MLQEYQHTFFKHLQKFNREAALAYALELLSSGKVSVPELYEGIITPSLNQITVCREEEDEKIWQEHTMTNIARTVVECAFPYVLQQKNPATKQNSSASVVVLCPEDEYHDIGARMGADFFTLENYQVFFIGGNTPQSNVASLCKTLHPRWVAISVSNFYHLVSIKSIVSLLKSTPTPPGILLSGSAFLRTGLSAKEFGAHSLLHTHQQVQQLEVTHP